MIPALISAPATAVYINGSIYGLVFDFRFTSSTNRKKVYSIDNLGAIELATLGHAISGNMQLYRLRGSGGIEGAGITVPLPDLSQENYFSITLLDIATKFVIFQAQNCSVESQTWTQGLKQFMLGDISWSALNWNNEVVPLTGS